jgi:hypothetical protein
MADAIPPFEDKPPSAPHVTPYDERHLNTYLLLLDADDAGIDWRSVVWTIFHIDAEREPVHALEVHRSHLSRARWMADSGYRDLLRPSPKK